MERKVLILIILPLSFFAFVYLHTTQPVRTIKLPVLPEFLEMFLLSLNLALIVFQQLNFQRNIRFLKEQGLVFENKISGYIKAITVRYFILALVGVISAVGLLFYSNVGFTIGYSIVLVLVSVFKPSPVRIIRLFQFNKEEKEVVYNFNRD